jgi:hypothetical protein
MWSSLLFGGGVNIRVWASHERLPGRRRLHHRRRRQPLGQPSGHRHHGVRRHVLVLQHLRRPHPSRRLHHQRRREPAEHLRRRRSTGRRSTTSSALSAISAYAPIDINASPGWDGSCVLDELAFYNTELSPTQVATHYTAGAVPWRGDTTGERIGRALT